MSLPMGFSSTHHSGLVTATILRQASAIASPSSSGWTPFVFHQPCPDIAKWVHGGCAIMPCTLPGKVIRRTSDPSRSISTCLTSYSSPASLYGSLQTPEWSHRDNMTFFMFFFLWKIIEIAVPQSCEETTKGRQNKRAEFQSPSYSSTSPMGMLTSCGPFSPISTDSRLRK